MTQQAWVGHGCLGLVVCGLVWVSGCTTGRCDPTVEDCGEDATSTTYEGPMVLQSVSSECVAGERSLDVVLEGAAASANVTFASHDAEGTVTWSERHRVPVASVDEAGWWQARWVSLAVADTSTCETLSACSGRYSAGERTLFGCGDASGTSGDSGDPGADGLRSSLTVVLELVDAADRDVQICYTWGDRADLSTGCLAVEPQ